MEKHRIKFGSGELFYRIYGEGRTVLLAFHGFGQSAEYFKYFSEQLSTIYTVYTFDLFFHGESEWTDDTKPLSKLQFKSFIDMLRAEHQITNFAVCGYSMGGKFALTCLEMFPENIKQLLLIAPDGIKTSFWYSLATYPQFFRNIFKKTIKEPSTFHRITRWANRLGLVDKSILKFASSQMNTEENRRRVYMSWVIFRNLQFNLKQVAEILNEQDIPTMMITGSYDKIITSENMMRLLKHVDDYQNIVLETGHNKLISESADFLARNKKELKFK
ncbi:hypothetical protein GCM10027429_21050 [Marivirga atlantica]|uniref:Alpha/beta hydrolase n=1 Tax=Marivirga atlantica TaxID=1548457 RepID=A0A937DEZ9_9BACT|nr:alpha/beta hydrolase [Marivirga atlantica]MBL0765722.1 alpha/beta hydrolase [Marivirga atlantica]